MRNEYIKKELVVGDFKYLRYFTDTELKRENLLFVDLIFFIDIYGITEIDKRIIFNHLLLIFNKFLKRVFQTPLKFNREYRNFINSSITEYLLFRKILLDNQYIKDADELFFNNQFTDLAGLRIISELGFLDLVQKLYWDILKLGQSYKDQNERSVFDVKNFAIKTGPLKKYYSPILFLQKEIRKKLTGYVDFFIVHGSYATADFVPAWSDLDTFVMLDRRVFESIESLKYTQKILQKLSLCCYKINPLAHHTFFIYPDFIGDYYLEAIFPEDIFNYSLALYKSEIMNLKKNDSGVENFYNLWRYAHYFREKVINDDYSQNYFSWEVDVANILILPALMLQMKKTPIYKKFSFGLARKNFPDFDFSLIDRASEIRKNWKLFNLLRFCPNALLNYFFVNKYRFFLMKHNKVKDCEMIKKFTIEALELYDQFFEYALNNYK